MHCFLSVLIPSIPSRAGRAAALYAELATQVGNQPVEILMLTDNKRRTVGKKREALVQAARGDYVAFVDDDDWVDKAYIANILPATVSHYDVVVFNTLSSLNGGPCALARHSLHHPNEEFRHPTFLRKPWQMHAWRRELAQAHLFPDANNGEDWGWCEKLCADASTEILVDGDLYLYRYSDSVTEATGIRATAT